ncbi:hypothetical protein CR513_01125, partial [Mucuna pruriens]
MRNLFESSKISSFPRLLSAGPSMYNDESQTLRKSPSLDSLLIRIKTMMKINQASIDVVGLNAEKTKKKEKSKGAIASLEMLNFARAACDPVSKKLSPLVISLNLTSTLNSATTFCFFLLHVTRFPPTKLVFGLGTLPSDGFEQ